MIIRDAVLIIPRTVADLKTADEAKRIEQFDGISRASSSPIISTMFGIDTDFLSYCDLRLNSCNI
jgi:hypothetical protein